MIAIADASRRAGVRPGSTAAAMRDDGKRRRSASPSSARSRPHAAESRVEHLSRQRPVEDLAEPEPGRLDARERDPSDRVEHEQRRRRPRAPSSATATGASRGSTTYARTTAPPTQSRIERQPEVANDRRARDRPTRSPPPGRAPPARCRRCSRRARRPRTRTPLEPDGSRPTARATRRHTSRSEGRPGCPPRSSRTSELREAPGLDDVRPSRRTRARNPGTARSPRRTGAPPPSAGRRAPHRCRGWCRRGSRAREPPTVRSAPRRTPPQRRSSGHAMFAFG